MAKIAGFDMTIIDPRTAFATPERFPDVALLAEWPDVALPKVGLDPFTGARGAHPRSRRSTTARSSPRSTPAASMSARSAAGRPTASGSSGCAPLGVDEAALAPHPCADRPRHRRAVAGRDRGRDPRRGDRGAAQPRRVARKRRRREVRAGSGRARRPARSSPIRSAMPAASLRKGTVLDARPGRAARRGRGQRGRRWRGSIADDVHEDEAAGRARAGRSPAAACASSAPFTGRSNLYAEAAGRARRRPRARSTGSTASTRRSRSRRLPEYRAGRGRADGRDGEDHSLRRAARQARRGGGAAGGAIRVAAFRPLKVGLVATQLPSLKPSVMDKTRRLLEERLAPAGASVVARRPRRPRRRRGRRGARAT